MITFLVSGLWHGAKWTFVLWGGLNGLYLVIELMLAPSATALARRIGLDRAPWLKRSLMVGVTFALTCFAWIFFRANSLHDSFLAARQIPAGLASLFGTVIRRDTVGLYGIIRGVGLQQSDFVVAIVSILALLGIEAYAGRVDLRAALARQPALVRWAAYYATIGCILFFGAFNSAQQFIYFQF
jgi:hypothetical protein